MSTFIWILIIVVAILVVIKLGRKPPRPWGGGAGQDTVGRIDLPNGMAKEEIPLVVISLATDVMHLEGQHRTC